MQSWVLEHPKVGSHASGGCAVFNKLTAAASFSFWVLWLQLQQMQSYGLDNPPQMYAAMLTYLNMTEGGETWRRRERELAS